MAHSESHAEGESLTDPQEQDVISEQDTQETSAQNNADQGPVEDSAQDSASDAPESESEDNVHTAVSEESDAVEAEENSADQQVLELTNDLQRLSAEYTNYRRRVERDRVGIAAQAKAEVVTQLLPLLDDLALAETHGDLEGPLKSLADKLNSTLAGLGLESYGEPGEEFDPELHEAVQDSSSGDEKVLGTVLRKGFRLGDRSLRTAMVIIADPEQ